MPFLKTSLRLLYYLRQFLTCRYALHTHYQLPQANISGRFLLEITSREVSVGTVPFRSLVVTRSGPGVHTKCPCVQYSKNLYKTVLFEDVFRKPH